MEYFLPFSLKGLSELGLEPETVQRPMSQGGCEINEGTQPACGYPQGEVRG